MSPVTDLISNRSQNALMMGVGAVFAGTASAALRGNTEFLPATLCLLFVIFLQLGANFYYVYYDESHNCGNSIDSKISGGKTPAALIKEFSFGMVLLAVMVGLALTTMGGWWVFFVGVFILAATWFTCGGSIPLLRTPYGVICTFILFGPVCVMSTSLIQSQHESTTPLNWFDITPSLYMSIVIGLMCANANLLYGYSTYLTDLRNSKQSFCTYFGRKTTRVVFFINGLLYTAVSVFMCLSLHLDLYGLDMVPSTICFIIDIYIWWKMRTLPRHKLRSLVPIGTFNVLLMGLLSFLIFELTGVPDDSQLTFFGL